MELFFEVSVAEFEEDKTLRVALENAEDLDDMG